MTIAAACRKALTGVGATIAAGSQPCTGICADLANAPTRTSTTAAGTAPPRGGSARIAETRYVPASWPSTMKPSSIARPPAAVTSRACRAARRCTARAPRPAISRKEATVVSSQKTYSTKRLSASTSPIIAPAKASSRAASRPASRST
ncbi:hypothetical protein SHIRM173S_02196 [Streptomyces hirsutus]